MFVFPRNVEIFCFSTTVMCGDEVFDDFRQVVFLCQFQSVRYVADNDLRALFVAEVLVWVDTARLVLGEEYRILHLANVMI